jgi:hemerythrin
MLIDADGFKQINDTYGHAAGDEVLRQLSSQLKRLARADDIVCRLGGDEFLIICGHTSLDGALKMAEKIRRGIASLCIPAGGGEWRGSISVGVAERTDDMDTPADLMTAADSGVYRAKLNGRNCVASAPWIKGGSEAPGSSTIAASQL